ncbi:MAG TPA: hypothetical protein VKB73_02195 [Gaiellaceae bacterium]|nr:hypothetical protein [Gaiellaceae bacterium]
MNAFIQQCRREWRRLGVRSAVADEMAAELAADLQEGASPEDVLGTDAADARAFAAAWARERGVVPRRTRNPRVIVPVVAAALALVAIAGAVLMATASSGNSQSVVVEPPPRLGFLEPARSERVRAYDGPPLHIRYLTTPAFRERTVRVKHVTPTKPRCVDGVDFGATQCVWPLTASGVESSGVDWAGGGGLGLTLFGAIGLLALAAAWLWNGARRSRRR